MRQHGLRLELQFAKVKFLPLPSHRGETESCWEEPQEGWCRLPPETCQTKPRRGGRLVRLFMFTTFLHDYLSSNWSETLCVTLPLFKIGIMCSLVPRLLRRNLFLFASGLATRLHNVLTWNISRWICLMNLSLSSRTEQPSFSTVTSLCLTYLLACAMTTWEQY